MSTIIENRNRTASSGSHTAARGDVLPSAARVSAALAVLRGVVGTVFVAHGAQKLFVFGFGGVIGAFEGMGVPLAGITGPAVAMLELFGGLALIAGVFTRTTALGLAGIMLGAMALVHFPAGFFLPNGMEFTLTLFGGVMALALAGPGVFSLEAVIARRRSYNG